MTHANETTHPNRAAFPAGMSGPSLRALKVAGIHSIAELTRWTERELAALHGMGPRALGLLKAALQERGRSFRAP